MKITNQIFFVTGSSSGLGRATAQRLHSLGARLALLDLAPSPEQVDEYGQDRAVGCACDVRSEEDVKAAIKAVDDKWPGGVVGGLVMAAGVGMAGKTVGNDGEPFDLSTFVDTININLVGSFNVARLVAARMVRQFPRASAKEVVEDDRGVIILTSSVSATEGQMGQVAYASSKSGVEGLTLPMARDLARHGIRVVTLAPSLFATAMGANTSDKVRANLARSLLFPPRFGHADEYAQLAVAVVENPMLNGSVLRIDGGSRMSKM